MFWFTCYANGEKSGNVRVALLKFKSRLVSEHLRRGSQVSYGNNFGKREIRCVCDDVVFFCMPLHEQKRRCLLLHSSHAVCVYILCFGIIYIQNSMLRCYCLVAFLPCPNKQRKKKGIVTKDDSRVVLSPKLIHKPLKTKTPTTLRKKSIRHFANQTLVSETRSDSIDNRRILVLFALRSSNQHVVLTLHTSSSTAHSEPHQVIAHVEAAGARTLQVSVLGASALTRGVSDAVVAVEAGRRVCLLGILLCGRGVRGERRHAGGAVGKSAGVTVDP